MRLRRYWVKHRRGRAPLSMCRACMRRKTRPPACCASPRSRRIISPSSMAGDIWVSDRDGGHPVQLTSHPASEYAPHFSPDGKWIAFSANYDNNTDVYVIPVEGGQPRRLTWHPAAGRRDGMERRRQARAVRVQPRDRQQPSEPALRSAARGRLRAKGHEGGRSRGQLVAPTASASPTGRTSWHTPERAAGASTAAAIRRRSGSSIRRARTLEKIPHENASDSNPLWIGDERRVHLRPQRGLRQPVPVRCRRAIRCGSSLTNRPGTCAMPAHTATRWSMRSAASSSPSISAAAARSPFPCTSPCNPCRPGRNGRTRARRSPRRGSRPPASAC